NSNRGDVLLHGRRAPIRGRICMDQFMVDVTDIPQARVGDEVVLLGKQGAEEITADEIAARTGTIAYETVSALTERLPRRYAG
ncbi:MAG: alanine racemase, partial [Armatimonadetes bacterium]|nr:alanine racemase [Armatimonadota bacterium]